LRIIVFSPCFWVILSSWPIQKIITNFTWKMPAKCWGSPSQTLPMIIILKTLEKSKTVTHTPRIHGDRRAKPLYMEEKYGSKKISRVFSIIVLRAIGRIMLFFMRQARFYIQKKCPTENIARCLRLFVNTLSRPANSIKSGVRPTNLPCPVGILAIMNFTGILKRIEPLELYRMPRRLLRKLINGYANTTCCKPVFE